jgi:hypothetical protein
MHIKQVLEVFAGKEFRLKLSKYNFYTKEIMFLGYVIIPGKISLDPEKIRVSRTPPIPAPPCFRPPRLIITSNLCTLITFLFFNCYMR